MAKLPQSLYKDRENNLKLKIFLSLLRINMNVNNVTVIIKYLSQTDPCLREINRSVGDFSIKIRKDPFQSLVESIMYQQLAGSADLSNITITTTAISTLDHSFLNRYFQLLIQYLGPQLGYQIKK